MATRVLLTLSYLVGLTTPICTEPPCAAELLSEVASTSVSGTNKGTTYAAGTSVYGPFESGFDSGDDVELILLGCSTPSDGYVSSGIDVWTTEGLIAYQCNIELPRLNGNSYVGLMNECGGDTDGGYHFHESLSCLYEDAPAGHSPALANTLSELDGVTQKLYGKWEDFDPATPTYVLPALDACNGHFGVTPDSGGATIYHYHVTDLPPFTVGCFGPDKSSANENILVSPTTCRGLYDGADGCGGSDVVTLTTASGSKEYDPWCPCWEGMTNVEGGDPATGISSPSPPPEPSPVSPPTSATTHTITLNPGWTWISSPLMVPGMGIAEAFGSMDFLSGNDVVKNQVGFSNYLDGYGWYGTITTVSAYDCYKFNLAVGGDLVLTGEPVDPSTNTISINAGWTWLGYPLMASGPLGTDSFLTDAASSTFSTGDSLKSQSDGFTSYIAGYGWYGSLNSLEAGQGYMIKTANANTLTFSLSRRRELRQADAGASRQSPATRRTDGVASLFNSRDFEFSMGVTAFVVIDGAVSHEGELAAFIDGQLRGLVAASPLAAPVGPYKGHRAFNLLAYGQRGGATVTFEYRHADGRVTPLQTTTPYMADDFLGSLDAPVVLRAAATSASAATSATTTAAASAAASATPASSTAVVSGHPTETHAADEPVYKPQAAPAAPSKAAGPAAGLSSAVVVAIAIGAALTLVVLAVLGSRIFGRREGDVHARSPKLPGGSTTSDGKGDPATAA